MVAYKICSTPAIQQLQQARQNMSSWSQTPNGITGVFYGRRCEVVRRGGAGRGTSSSFRASVEGIEEGALRNKGYARDYHEGKQICFEALTAAGLIPPKTASSQAGSSRYAPHAIEVRARAIDQAVAFVNGVLGAGIAGGEGAIQEVLSRRLSMVKTVAVNLETFMLAAAQDQQALPTSGANNPAQPSGDAKS